MDKDEKIKVDMISVLVGFWIVIYMLSSLFSPPEKHNDFSLHDRYQTTIRELGRSGTPNL
jgi:hypothetical protein